MSERDDLSLTIARQLEIDGQHARYFEARDKQGIDTFRSAGRRAARLVGLNVRTARSDPAKCADGRAVVIVCVTGGLAEEDREGFDERRGT